MTLVIGDAVLGGRYCPAITSRERLATSTGVLPTWHLTQVGGATLTSKDRMTSGGLVSLGFVEGMNDTPVTTGLGVAVAVSKITTEF